MSTEYAPGLDDVVFDTRGWQLAESDREHRLWLTQNHVAVQLYYNARPPRYGFDDEHVEMARAVFADSAERGSGALLSVARLSTPGTHGITGVFKYPSPVQGDLGTYYLGNITLLFRDFWFQIVVDSVERGTTGLREAWVEATHPAPPYREEDVIRCASMDEMFEHMAARRAKAHAGPSDDEAYDAQFPDHPLTKVRGLLRHIAGSLTLTDRLAREPRYVVDPPY